MLTFYTHLNARLSLEIKDLSLSTDLSLAAAWLALHTAGFHQKSDNLQYNMMVPWFAGTNYLLTKSLMYQVLFFQNFLQNPLQNLFQFIFFTFFINLQIEK